MRDHPELHEIHKKFIVTTVDKANSNYSFICKKHYCKVLLDELGFDSDTLVPQGNLTYKPVNLTTKDIVTEHVSILSNLFEIDITEDNKKIPYFYAIPKFHKTPYKFRFISGAKFCTTKQISILLNNALICIRAKLKADCLKECLDTPYNYFWSINSTDEFLSRLANTPETWSAQVYDFATLYTNLDLDIVKTNLFELFDNIFNSYTRKFLCVKSIKGSGFFSHRTYNTFHTFTKSLIKQCVEFVLFQTYTIFAGQCFQQIRGVPMGGNSSPLIADLFLCMCEINFLRKLKEEGHSNILKAFSNTSRYIDDVFLLNFKHFENYVDKIYPCELKIERNGNDDHCLEYLDVKLQFSDGDVQTSVFHKVDLFNFDVTTLTFPQNCAPIALGYNVFAGQVLRYGRICSSLDHFIFRVRKTVDLLVSRGYISAKLTQYFLKMLHKHSCILQKFNLFGAQQLVDQIFVTCPAVTNAF